MLFHYSMVTMSKNCHKLILKPQFLHFDSFHRPPFYTMKWIKVHLAMFFSRTFSFLFSSYCSHLHEFHEVPVKIFVYRWRSNQLRKVAKLITAPLFRQIATMDNYCLQNLRHMTGIEKPFKIFLLRILKSMNFTRYSKTSYFKNACRINSRSLDFLILKFKFSIL